jgi:hypothetical protein
MRDIGLIRSFITLFLLAGITLFMGACTLFEKGTKTAYPSTYSEDLSYLRKGLYEEEISETPQSSEQLPSPTFVQPRQDINRRIDAILDTLASRNIQRGYLEGYSVQVISTRSRTEATEVRNKIVEEYEELRPEIIYDQPSYKVKIGFFSDRLQAYEVYSQLPQSDFPFLVIVPERRPLKND